MTKEGREGAEGLIWECVLFAPRRRWCRIVWEGVEVRDR